MSRLGTVPGAATEVGPIGEPRWHTPADLSLVVLAAYGAVTVVPQLRQRVGTP